MLKVVLADEPFELLSRISIMNELFELSCCKLFWKIWKTIIAISIWLFGSQNDWGFLYLPMILWPYSFINFICTLYMRIKKYIYTKDVLIVHLLSGIIISSPIWKLCDTSSGGILRQRLHTPTTTAIPYIALFIGLSWYICSQKYNKKQV